MLKDFWKKAQRYISKNKDSINKPDNFIYNNSEIEPEVVAALFQLKSDLDYYSEAYDREYDYARLLRMENSSLNLYIEELKNMIDEQPPGICIDLVSDDDSLLS